MIAYNEAEARATNRYDDDFTDENKYACIELPRGTTIGNGGYISVLSEIIKASGTYTFMQCRSEHGQGIRECTCGK